jgi:hypothetical protein
MRSASRVRPARIESLSQRTRRVIAVVAMLGLPAMFIWSAVWQRTSVPTIIWGPGSFLLIGATLIGALILYRFVRGRADMPGTQLDERERQLRDRAWILSYQVLALVVVLLGAAIVIPVLGFGEPITIDASIAGAVALCLGVLLPLLPAACLAWLEPDAVVEP